MSKKTVYALVWKQFDTSVDLFNTLREARESLVRTLTGELWREIPHDDLEFLKKANVINDDDWYRIEDIFSVWANMGGEYVTCDIVTTTLP